MKWTSDDTCRLTKVGPPAVNPTSCGCMSQSLKEQGIVNVILQIKAEYLILAPMQQRHADWFWAHVQVQE